jgi:Xaa-Pro aminopeptidase
MRGGSSLRLSCNLQRLQAKLQAMDCHGLLVPSSDEYLSEFAQPHAQRLRWLTGFGGSTGQAIVLRDRAALFLDGRYRIQGKKETAGLAIEVLDASETVKHRWLAANMRRGERFAIDCLLRPYHEVERLMAFMAGQGIEVLGLLHNPIDELWQADRPPALSSTIFDYPIRFAGRSSSEKCVQLREWMKTAGLDCYLLCDSEDAAWLLNVRTHDSLHATATGWHIVPIPLCRAIVDADGKVFWFVERARLDTALAARLAGEVEVMEPGQFETILNQRLANKAVGGNLRKTPHRFAAIAAKVGTLRDDSFVFRGRWKKHPNEIERAREGHLLDGQAVIRFMAWLQRTVPERTVTELEAAQKLTEFRSELPEYKGISMPLMSAAGPSGAMAHYVPSEQSNREINGHPIYWMDSGGQYYGCTTDNTICLAVGKPEARHTQAHTLVVKGYIALARAQFPAGILSSQLDSLARQFLWQQGMDYAHGTSHGVGNFMNVHEGPNIRKDPDYPTVAPIEVGMILSNEPGFYVEDDFGVRVESHMVTVPSQYEGFLKFETLSRLPIDPKLIDESLLTAEEKQWLVDHHQRIAECYRGCFDGPTWAWVQGIVDAYLAMRR